MLDSVGENVVTILVSTNLDLGECCLRKVKFLQCMFKVAIFTEGNRSVPRVFSFQVNHLLPRGIRANIGDESKLIVSGKRSRIPTVFTFISESLKIGSIKVDTI